MEIATGYFALAKGYSDEGYTLVSIAKKKPWFLDKGLKLYELPFLMPTESILKLKDNQEEYEVKFKKEILGNTTIEEVKSELKKICEKENNDKVVLLCYEKPSAFCHRHIVAKWLGDGIGKKIEEKTFGPQRSKTFEEYKKDFISLLPKVSDHHNQRDIFCDVCRIFCLSLRGVVTIDCKEKEEIEKEYQRYVTKYGNEGMKKISILLSYVVEALELKRQDFLGHIYESLNATNTRNGQFLTPDSVARMMALITFQGEPPKHGKIVKFNDCSCGAGALLIEAAEAFISQGGRQGDLILFGEDLDPTACYITYTQFSLLGYPAVVTHQDTLSMKVYEGPWYTIGYFAHGMPMRLLCKHIDEAYAEKHPEDQAEVNAEDNVPCGTEEDKPLEVNVRELVQSEFQF